MKLKLNKNRIYYTATILTIAIIVVVGIVYLIRKPESAAAWFNDDWYYRQSVPITNGGSALTDYQIAITLDTATLITAGKMQSDCDDIRFTDAQGNVLSYWIEENNPGCNSATTKIWTKASSVPAGSSTIYLYYGNQSASNAQNGNNVFTFFDDFSINLSKWINPTGCAATITSGVMQISSSTGCDSTPVYVNSLSLSDATGYIMEFRGKFSSGGGGRLQTYQRYRPSNGHSGRFWTSGINTTAYQEWTGSFGGTTNVGANNMAADTWY
ncbi:MAG: hypothetical protein CO133_02160, partial [Candidatus Komeilibacteria bacterium CG_4_9_14_3_um_filter_37_5]